MSFTYDISTTSGLVRRRINDVDETSPIFNDAEISAFLAVEGDDWRKGAALCLETIASSEALIQKVIRTLDLQTDGAKLGAELRAQAAGLRAQAAAGITTGGAITMVDASYGGGNPVEEFDRGVWWVP